MGLGGCGWPARLGAGFYQAASRSLGTHLPPPLHPASRPSAKIISWDARPVQRCSAFCYAAAVHDLKEEKEGVKIWLLV